MSGVLTASGWGALVAIPLAAVLGAILRRMKKGVRLGLRMRPHVAIGYAVSASAVVHVATAARASSSSDPAGIWIGAAALLALMLQTFVGASLQAPGAYRRPLLRWHMVAFWSALGLALAHVALDAPYLQGMSGSP